MSTTPFMLIEGPMALPSLRPLGDLSRSFGREWALLPPNISFRFELKALYAAMLRTFCLSSEAIRSMCRWEPRRPPQWGATPAAALPAGQPGAGVGARVAPPPGQAPQPQRNMLAGSACALGGAAILAWIVIHNTAPGEQRRSASAGDAPALPATVRSATPMAEPATQSATQHVDSPTHVPSAPVVSPPAWQSA